MGRDPPAECGQFARGGSAAGGLRWGGRWCAAVARPGICRGPTPSWFPSGGPVSGGPARKRAHVMTSAAIYARVSSARQKQDQTIASQTAALRELAGQLGAELPEEWVFEDEGHSGGTLVRPALEALRDLSAPTPLDYRLLPPPHPPPP